MAALQMQEQDLQDTIRKVDGDLHKFASCSEDKDDDDDSEVKVAVDQLLSEDGATNEIVDEFTCKICMVHLIGSSPMLTGCSHLFCGDCLAQWFTIHTAGKSWAQRAKTGRSVPCPVCKEPLQKEQDLHPICHDGEGGSKILHRILCDTKIVCANSSKCNPDGRCDWIGDYGSYQAHIRLCQNLPVSDFSLSAQVAKPMTPASQTNDAGLGDSPHSAGHASPKSEKSTGSPSMQPLLAEDVVSEVQTEPVCAPWAGDVELAGLIGSLVGAKTTELEVETEDTCSTNSEQSVSVEPSDSELSEQDESAPTSNIKTVVPVYDHMEGAHLRCEAQQAMMAQNAARAAEMAQHTRHTAMMARHAAQWQMAQYQAVHYQAAQMQMARLQQAQMAQWQYAQQAQAYAAQTAQLHASQVDQRQRAHAAQGICWLNQPTKQARKSNKGTTVAS